MDKRNKRLAVKGLLFTLNYLSIAGLVTGILIFIGYMASVSYRGDRVNTSYEDSYSFDQTYEQYWYSAAQYINLQEMLEVDGAFTTDREMTLPIYLNDEKTITIKYKLEDIVRWGTLGFDSYQEDVLITELVGEASTEEPTEYISVYKLEEHFHPLNYESLAAAAKEYDLNYEETNMLYSDVENQLHYICACVEDYHWLKNDLDINNTNFRYYARRGDGAIFTNLSIDDEETAYKEIKKLGRYYIWNSATSELEHSFSSGSIMEIQREVLQMNWLSYSENSIPYGTDKGSWDVLTGVDMSFSVADSFHESYQAFELFRPLYEAGISLMGASLITYLITFIVLTVMAGRKPDSEEIRLKGIDHWKTEIAVLYFIALATILGLADFGCCQLIAEIFDRNLTQLWLCVAIAAAAAIISNMGLLSGWLSFARRIKAHTLWKNSLICGLSQGLQECWDARTVTLKTGVLYVLYAAINFLLFIITIDNEIGIVFLLIFNAAVGFLILRQAIWRQQIQEGIARIAEGNLEYKINETAMSGDERYLAQAINNIGDGLVNAVEKSVKSERLKADLITNVSHDIKTPLTSIINYVDLLKRENIPDEKVQGYIRILDEKSQRLKTLTEDLVEASKVSSGNVKLEFANVDFVELIHQTNGEFSEKFAAKELKLITNLPKEPAYIRADGRRIWRVLENLYNNAAKYAMPGSRVYADLKVSEENVVFTLKNMSEQPLNFAAEELTERFVRGDVSRTTEGSGLGLSIAKNLTEIQGGTFDVYLDGDLFRVTVAFPRVK